MDLNRLLVVKAVQAGQLPWSALTNEDLLCMELELMDRIIDDRVQTNPMVFSGVDGLVH